MVVFLLLTPWVIVAKSDKPVPDNQETSPEIRAEQILRQLSTTIYTARRNLPVSDTLFVENGMLVESLFAFNSRGGRVAAAADQEVTVSKVVLMTKAVQVFFKEGFAVIVITERDRETKDMTLPQLVSLARKGLGSMLEAKADQKPKALTWRVRQNPQFGA
jgi:hypothetical protein